MSYKEMPHDVQFPREGPCLDLALLGVDFVDWHLAGFLSDENHKIIQSQSNSKLCVKLLKERSYLCYFFFLSRFVSRKGGVIVHSCSLPVFINGPPFPFLFRAYGRNARRAVLEPQRCIEGRVMVLKLFFWSVGCTNRTKGHVRSRG